MANTAENEGAYIVKFNLLKKYANVIANKYNLAVNESLLKEILQYYYAIWLEFRLFYNFDQIIDNKRIMGHKLRCSKRAGLAFYSVVSFPNYPFEFENSDLNELKQEELSSQSSDKNTEKFENAMTDLAILWAISHLRFNFNGEIPGLVFKMLDDKHTDLVSMIRPYTIKHCVMEGNNNDFYFYKNEEVEIQAVNLVMIIIYFDIVWNILKNEENSEIINVESSKSEIPIEIETLIINKNFYNIKIVG